MVVTYNGIQIGNYAIYLNEPYPTLFSKKYKGILIVVDKDDNCTDTKYIHFRLDKGSKKQLIFKTRTERMDRLIFNDNDMTITCEFEKNPKNKCANVLTFTEEEFEEISDALPQFMKDCGCEFETIETEGVLELKF